VGRSLGRMVRAVSAAVYGVVLAAGVYYAAVHGDAVDLLGFGGVMLVLFGVLAVEREWDPRLSLAVDVVLFGLAAATDGSGLAKALFVLAPFAAYLAFGRRVGLLAGGLCVVGMVAVFQVVEPGWLGEAEYVNDLLMFAVGLVLALAMAETAAGEARVRARLEEQAVRVAELSAAAERTRIARDLHDSLGHHLTAVAVQLERADAFRERDPGVVVEAVAEARASTRKALEDVRRSVRLLRAGFRLEPALRELVGSTTGPAVAVEFHGDEEGADETALTTLYRAAQEALTNARRHARASEVRIAVHFDPAWARLEVADDGRGTGGRREGHGLSGMRERAVLAGGDLEVSSTGRGTTVTVVVPRRAG